MALPSPQIILFGDSLIEQSFSVQRHGFGAALANAYVRRADVLNRGLSGYNSKWLSEHYFEKVLTAYAEANVILWIILVGANDACLPGFVHHVPITYFKKNLEMMIGKIRTIHQCRILVISPPPIDERLLELYGPRNGVDRDFGVTKCYADAVKEVVSKGLWDHKDVGILDFYKLMMESLGQEHLKIGKKLDLVREYLTDGLHLGSKGYDLMYDAIMKHIIQEWSEILPENLPMTAPWWGDFLENVPTMQHGEF